MLIKNTVGYKNLSGWNRGTFFGGFLNFTKYAKNTQKESFGNRGTKVYKFML